MDFLQELGITDVNGGAHDGVECLSGEECGVITSYSPATGERIADVAKAGAASYEALMDRSGAAFEKWRMMPAPQRGEIVRQIGDALRFLETMVQRPLEELRSPDFFTSHEGLHLDYETAVSELPPLRSGWYNLGTHMPWIGDRTRALDGAHVEYFRGIENPVGVKVGPSMDPQELVDLCRVLNPENETGRLVLIHRLGAERVRDLLPPLIEAVLRNKLSVVWCNDPMHGNTYQTSNGFKTRNFDRILAEIQESFAVHEELGSIQGGVHFEMTGENVTECIGGARGLTEDDLHRDYRSEVDPRLNDEQALEMAFLIATRMQRR